MAASIFFAVKILPPKLTGSKDSFCPITLPSSRVLTSSSSGSPFLLFALICMCTRQAVVLKAGNLSQMLRKREPKEEEKRTDKNLTILRPLYLW